MEKIKLRKTGKSTVGIFTNNYGRGIEKINKLAQELKKDYPQLKDSDISIDILGGPRYKYMLIVEAVVDEPLEEYYLGRSDWFGLRY